MKKTYLTLCLILPQILFAQDVSLPENRSRVDVENTLKVVERQFSTFKVTSQKLYDDVKLACDTGSPQEAEASLQDAYRAWVAVEMYQFGPIEQQSAALHVNFWPDKKGFTQKHLEQFNNLSEEEQRNPEFVRKLSAAVQGLPAAEILMKEGNCNPLIGVSANIALYADELNEAWFGADGWAEYMQSAGADNAVYLSPQEAISELYTATEFGLQRAKMRLEQPMGSIQNPSPGRAEGALTGLSFDLVKTQLRAVQEVLDEGFSSEIDDAERNLVNESFESAIKQIDQIDLSLVEAVTNNDTRVPVESAILKIEFVREEFVRVVGPALGVNTGFSPADGD